MRKELLTTTIIAIMFTTSNVSLANNYDTPAMQYAPANIEYENQSNYQTQYPLPVNNYQTQGYTNGMYNTNYQQQLQGNVIMVPANTVFQASAMTPLNSEYTKVGDSVSFYLGSDFYYGNKLIAAAGSRVNGTVLQAKRGGFAGKNGKIQVKFTNIITPTGQMIPISAHIETSDGTGILKAGTIKDTSMEYAKDIGVGAASGAVLGTAMGALSSSSVGRGAIYGTALGGGLGLAKSLIDKGENVEIPQNAILNIVLNQPITVSSNTPF